MRVNLWAQPAIPISFSREILNEEQRMDLVFRHSPITLETCPLRRS